MLSLNPQHINKDFWYYETEKGIACLYTVFSKTVETNISWKKILRSVARYLSDPNFIDEDGAKIVIEEIQKNIKKGSLNETKQRRVRRR